MLKPFCDICEAPLEDAKEALYVKLNCAGVSAIQVKMWPEALNRRREGASHACAGCYLKALKELVAKIERDIEGVGD